MKRPHALLLVFVFFLCWSGIGQAEDSIVFGVDPTKPPMQYVDEQGNIVGFEIDLIKEMGLAGGFTPVFKKVAWKDLFAGLGEGQYDAACASISITDVRQRQMRFTAPYYQIAQAILALPDSGIHTIGDLAGKSVGAKKGTTSQAVLSHYPGASSVEFPDIISAVKALYAREVDAVICDGPVAGYYATLDEKKENHVEIKFVLQGEKAEFYGIALKMDDRKMERALNRALHLVQKSNKDIELQRKWFSGLLECY